MKRATFGLLLSGLCSCAVAFAATEQKRPDLDALLAQLRVRTGSASNDAKFALISRGKSDPEAKAYIAERLPALLESYGGGNDVFENMSWGNTAEVAGVLKVVGAVPILCHRIDAITTQVSGLSFSYNFMNRAAVPALIQIGTPAVPAVIGVLKNGTSLQREEAAYVLGEIGTPAATEALQQRLQRETDPKVRGRIQEVLKQGPSRPPKK